MKNPFHKMMFLLATVAVIFSTLSLLNYREEDLIQPNENQIQNFFKKPIKKESEEVFEPLSSLYKDNKIHHADSMLQEENIIYYIQENTILRFDEETLEFQSYALSSFYPVEMQIYQHQLIVFGVTSNEKIIEIDQDKSFPYADYEFQIVFLEKKNLKKIRQIHFYHCYYIESQIMNGKMYFSSPLRTESHMAMVSFAEVPRVRASRTIRRISLPSVVGRQLCSSIFNCVSALI